MLVEAIYIKIIYILELGMEPRATLRDAESLIQGRSCSAGSAAGTSSSTSLRGVARCKGVDAGLNFRSSGP